MFIIYMHTSPIGKSYIGYTSKNIEDRLNEHVYASEKGSKTKFHKAIRKYGIENFESIILKDDINTLENAKEYEIFFIKQYNTYGRNSDGYNMTEGGDGNRLFGEENGMFGRTHTDEVKDKLSKLAKERTGEENSYIKSNPSEEDKINRALKVAEARKINGTYSKEYNGMYGNNHTEETKQKIRETIKENGGRVGENNSFFGKEHSEETKKLIGEKNKGKIRKKEKCDFCDREICVNNINKHQNSCEQNPNKTNIKYNKNRFGR